MPDATGQSRLVSHHQCEEPTAYTRSPTLASIFHSDLPLF